MKGMIDDLTFWDRNTLALTGTLLVNNLQIIIFSALHHMMTKS